MMAYSIFQLNQSSLNQKHRLVSVQMGLEVTPQPKVTRAKIWKPWRPLLLKNIDSGQAYIKM